MTVSGTNGHVSYGGVTVEGFVISPETGVISLTKVLDREQQDHYSVTGNLQVPLVLALRHPHAVNIGLLILPVMLRFLGIFLLCDVVYAKDGGMPPNFAKAKVHITVLDENDNAPAFGRLQYSLELPENLTPVEIFLIKATDHDSGDSGRVEYRVIGKYHA